MLGPLLARLGAGGAGEPQSRKLGRAGERLAARHLRALGYRILGRNVKVKIGEADIVAEAPDRKTIVIVEVKTRSRGSNRSLLGEVVAPEASVHQTKRRKLRAIARVLVNANGWRDRPVRIDVVAIEWPQGQRKPELRHHVGINT